MPVNVERGKSEIELERYAIRKDAFFSLTIAENRARLDGISNMADIIKELKFIETLIKTEGLGK